MNHYTTVIGLDVHKDTIVAAVLPEESNRPTETSKLENRPEVVPVKLWHAGMPRGHA